MTQAITAQGAAGLACAAGKARSRRGRHGETAADRRWRAAFILALAQTSNVTAAAAQAGVSTARVYRARKNEPGFAAQWRLALAMGYETLELELIAYLRSPQPDRKMDVAGAVRLLALHRAEVSRRQDFEDAQSDQDVLQSLDAMMEDMRRRRTANADVLDAAAQAAQ